VVIVIINENGVYGIDIAELAEEIYQKLDFT